MASALNLDLVTKRLEGAGIRVEWRSEDIRQVLAKYGATSSAGGSSIMRAVTAAAPIMAAAPAAKNDPNRSYTFTISTSSPDRMNDVIVTSGWKLDAYKRNPVVLWQHNNQSLPIGRTTNIWIDGNRLRATVEIASDLTSYAATVRSMIDGGFISGASVGFRPLQFKFSTDKARPNGIDFLSAELLEWSIVTIPANPDALIDAGQTGKAAKVSARHLTRIAELAAMKARW
jgi:HK97 family phage prohead protease